MARPDYPKSRQERLFVVSEPGAGNVLTHPNQTGVDSVPILPGLNIASALSEWTESLFRDGKAGVSELIKRKKQPGEFSIPTYVTGSDTATVPPKYGVLLAKGMGLETIGGSSVTYSLQTDISEKLVSLHHWIDNGMRALRGGIVNTIEIAVSGSDEGKITFGGMTLNEVFAGSAVLEGGIDNVVTTIVLEAGQGRRYIVGPDAGDFVYVQIDAEVIRVTAVNYTNDNLTVTRAQLGTSAASHSDGAFVDPWVPTTDPDAADKIAPLTAGGLDLGGITNFRGIAATLTINNNMEARLDEYGLSVSTGYRPTNEKRRVGGNIRCYFRQQNQAFYSDPERGLEVSMAIRAGVAGSGTFLLTITAPRTRIRRAPIDGGGSEFALDSEIQCLEGTGAGNDELTLVYS